MKKELHSITNQQIDEIIKICFPLARKDSFYYDYEVKKVDLSKNIPSGILDLSPEVDASDYQTIHIYLNVDKQLLIDGRPSIVLGQGGFIKYMFYNDDKYVNRLPLTTVLRYIKWFIDNGFTTPSIEIDSELYNLEFVKQ